MLAASDSLSPRSACEGGASGSMIAKIRDPGATGQDVAGFLKGEVPCCFLPSISFLWP